MLIVFPAALEGWPGCLSCGGEDPLPENPAARR